MELNSLSIFWKISCFWGTLSFFFSFIKGDEQWVDQTSKFSSEYMNDVKSFSDFSYNNGKPQGEEIFCPCARCKNWFWVRRHVVYDLLIVMDFLISYNFWIHYGKETQVGSFFKEDSLKKKKRRSYSFNDFQRTIECFKTIQILFNLNLILHEVWGYIYRWPIP